MDTFRFLNFPVYGRSKSLYKKVCQATDGIPDFSLKNQARRASLSIVLNIAEGSGKKSDKDFARFLQISLGSVNELYACVDLMKDAKLIRDEDVVSLQIDCEEIAKQLGGFSKRLYGVVTS